MTLEHAHHPDETAGLLFGRHFSDGRNPCVLVSDLATPLEGEVIGTRASVKLTARGTQAMRARARTATPCADPVGWAHTHPTFEAYFSNTDMTEQSMWKENTSVGIVMSGQAGRDYRVFVGPESTEGVLATPARSTEDTVAIPISRLERRRPDQPLTPRPPESSRRRVIQRPTGDPDGTSDAGHTSVVLVRAGAALAALALLLGLIQWNDARGLRDDVEAARTSAATAEANAEAALRKASRTHRIALRARRDARAARRLARDGRSETSEPGAQSGASGTGVAP